MTPRHFAIILIFTFISACGLQFGAKETASRAEFRSQIIRVDCDNRDRLEAVRELFLEIGAKHGEINIEDFGEVKNLVVTLSGKTDETIIVGAHFDKTTLGCGAIDNWTGIVILANLYKSLKTGRNEKTYRFVAFGDEEKGLIGSKAMVKAIPEERVLKHCAMVNLDSFGFDNLWALQKTSDAPLINFAKNLAGRKDISFMVKDFPGASADSRSFQLEGIPSITMSGLGDDWKNYLHQDTDQVSAIKVDKVYENYLFALDYLAELDSETCDAFR